MKVQLKTEEKLYDAQQFYESVGLVIGQVLGGKKDDAPPPPPAGAPARNMDDLAARMARVLG